MTRPVIFRPAAEREVLEAERWFEERRPELGRRFRASVDATIERMRPRAARVALLERGFKDPETLIDLSSDAD